ncbi:MAG: neutral/alkaline non-lysosomal ceramidase N-terminal domain-containing protein [Deltaproteobacteria bacterium]|nr:neutral/alkaline non-lysosomal ceramidase N-terminal domain-containing protein [Deltaproteobacteria bacterium]
MSEAPAPLPTVRTASRGRADRRPRAGSRESFHANDRNRARAWLLRLVCLALASGCAPLDRRHPHRAKSFLDELTAIDLAIERADRDAGPFLAGFARVPIDSPEGVPLAGYGDRDGVPSVGVKDQPYVRAFAIGAGRARVLIFTADILLLHTRAAQAIRASLSDVLPSDHVFFTASHTHSGPGGSAPGLLFELVFGPFDESAFQSVVTAHVLAGQRALADLGPARVGIGRSTVPGLIANRIEKGGRTDDELFAMVLEKEGRTGVLWSFGCHAVTLPATNLKLSADYPGFVASHFEGRSAEVVGFAAGGVGSSNPLHERDDPSWIVEPLERGLASAIESASKHAKSSGALASSALRVSEPTLRYRVTKETMIWPGLIKAVLPEERLPFGTVTIGDASFLFAPSEVSGELTAAARNRARRFGSELVIFPFNGSYFGYVVPRRAYDLPEPLRTDMTEYETQVMTFFGPFGGDLIVRLGLRLTEGVRARAAEAAGAPPTGYGGLSRIHR